jgi:hypothetical protein
MDAPIIRDVLVIEGIYGHPWSQKGSPPARSILNVGMVYFGRWRDPS